MKITNTGDVKNNRIFGMIAGPSGVGKTFLSSTIPTDETLFASAEAGTMCLSSKGIKIDTVTISSMNDMKELYINLTTNESWKKKYKHIYIDSLTEIGEKMVAELKLDPKLSADNMALKLWGKYSDDFTKLIKAFRDINHPYNFWFTCLNKFEKDGLELKEEFNFPGSKVKDNVKSWFDIVLKYDVFESEGVKHRKLITDDAISRLAKDRSGNLNKYEEPNLGLIMKKILGSNK